MADSDKDSDNKSAAVTPAAAAKAMAKKDAENKEKAKKKKKKQQQKKEEKRTKLIKMVQKLMQEDSDFRGKILKVGNLPPPGAKRHSSGPLPFPKGTPTIRKKGAAKVFESKKKEEEDEENNNKEDKKDDKDKDIKKKNPRIRNKTLHQKSCVKKFEDKGNSQNFGHNISKTNFNY